MAETSDINAMLKMYDLLRDEINQSNRLQQRIVLGLATFVGLVFGLVFSGTLSSLETQSSISIELVIAAVLPIIGSAAGIWLVEQSRVMMAGNYLQILEYKINNQVGNAPMSWENWLRRDRENPPDEVGAPGDASWNDPQNVYDLAYKFGYLSFFLILGSLSVLLYVNEVIVAESVISDSLSLFNVLRILWPLTWSGFFLLVAVKASQVLSHGTQNMKYSDIKGWEREVFQRETLLSEAFDDNSELVDNIEFEEASNENRFRELLELAIDE